MAMEPSFAAIMSRLRDGDQDAAAEIFRRFVHRLIALASRQFDARHRSKADPEDVVQSVYLSFFRRNDRSPFELSDWDGLWALLAMITVRKCIDHRELWRTKRRDLRREVANDFESMNEACWSAIDRGPTPFQAIVLNETIEKLMRMGPSQRTIAELILQGYTSVEIARLCDCSERTVSRVQHRIRERATAIGAFELRT